MKEKLSQSIDNWNGSMWLLINGLKNQDGRPSAARPFSQPRRGLGHRRVMAYSLDDKPVYKITYANTVPSDAGAPSLFFKGKYVLLAAPSRCTTQLACSLPFHRVAPRTVCLPEEGQSFPGNNVCESSTPPLSSPS